MIHKTFGMIDQMVYAQDEKDLLVNLYAGSSIEAEFE